MLLLSLALFLELCCTAPRFLAVAPMGAITMGIHSPEERREERETFQGDVLRCYGTVDGKILRLKEQ